MQIFKHGLDNRNSTIEFVCCLFSHNEWFSMQKRYVVSKGFLMHSSGVEILRVMVSPTEQTSPRSLRKIIARSVLFRIPFFDDEYLYIRKRLFVICYSD